MRPFIKLFVVFALAAYAALSADESISKEVGTPVLLSAEKDFEVLRG